MNREITQMLINKLSSLTLSTDNGKFLADKSYGFDTMFFACRFIQRFRFGNIYKKADLVELSDKYIRDLFCLRPASQVSNYFTEAIALLVFCNVLQEDKKGKLYKIIDEVINSYGSIETNKLIDFTHEEEPWINTEINKEIIVVTIITYA